MSARRARPLAMLLPLVACAAEQPVPETFDRTAGHVEIVIAGDGFVRCAGRRMPVEQAVLELRQHTRTMTFDERARFVVALRFAESLGAAAGAAEARDFLLDQLEIMGVLQIDYL